MIFRLLAYGVLCVAMGMTLEWSVYVLMLYIKEIKSERRNHKESEEVEESARD